MTGIQFATNLGWLSLARNQISDLSPIAGLIGLHTLWINNNPLSDISPVGNLKDLTVLVIDGTDVSDLTPVAGLINLKELGISTHLMSDLSPLKGLINLNHLWFHRTQVTDLSPLAQLANLRIIGTWGSPFSDLSPLAGLTELETLDICGAKLSDLSPLTGLTGLKTLYLARNGISDISPIAALTGLDRIRLEGNHITDISPLAGLTNLKWLHAGQNEISDFSPLDGIRENITLVWFDNPGYPKGGPKIEGPWLWVVLPDTGLGSGEDLLSQVSDGRVTEETIATHGATEGKPLGDNAWKSHKLPPTGFSNIQDMLKRTINNGVIYGTVSLQSPRQQETTMYVGSEHGLKVWLNGDLVYQRLSHWGGEDYNDFFKVTLQQGRNVLLVAARTHSNAFFGFEPETEYTVANPGVGYAFSETPIHVGDTFTLDIRAENVFDLAGWQFDIAFDPAVLEALDVSEGDFLKADGGTTFFQSGRIDNVAGKITGLNTARLGERGANGSGTILQVRLKAKSEGETELALGNFVFGASSGENILAGPLESHITVEARLPSGDVNGDGVVNVLDLILVAQQLGQRVPPNSPVDVNRDGVINIFDLTLVAQGIGGAAAPAIKRVDSERDRDLIEAWIAEASLIDDGSIAFRQGIENLQNLLASLIIPQETALHANYPNPFNPETWIPYQLAAPAEVTMTIHDMNGVTVRRLEMGHQAAGLYQSRSRALYWDGRNGRGESVASGLYFYTLRAGEFTATRKMLIRK